MEILVLAKMMELDNLYHIYLFYVDDRWCALDYYNTLVSDTHIQVSVPPTVYSYRNGYDKWCTKLFVDKNKLHILKHQ